MLTSTARALAIAEKYRCRPARTSGKKLQHAPKQNQTILPPLKSVKNLAEYNIIGAHFNPTELQVEAGISELDWSNIGRAITHVQSSSKWWIGDWMLAGMKAYGKDVTYSLAQQATGFDRKGLYFTSWVTSRFEPHRRVAALSFSHHQAVAALPPDVADRLLEEAVEMGYTSEQLYQYGREECGKKRKYSLNKVGVYLSEDTLGIVQVLAKNKGTRLAWFLNGIICQWLVEHGHKAPKKTANEIFKERQAAGFCGFCGKNVPEEGKKSCEKCLARARIYDNFRRNEKIEAPQLGGGLG